MSERFQKLSKLSRGVFFEAGSILLLFVGVPAALLLVVVGLSLLLDKIARGGVKAILKIGSKKPEKDPAQNKKPSP